jgi:hypothetical protein
VAGGAAYRSCGHDMTTRKPPMRFHSASPNAVVLSGFRGLFYSRNLIFEC